MKNSGNLQDSSFTSAGLGYWKNEGITKENWNDHKWQLKNRITNLKGLEQHLHLTSDERNGVILSGDKLALSITPHFFNLIDRNDPNCPIRRQVIPTIEEITTSPEEMADPKDGDNETTVGTRVLNAQS